MSSPDRAVEARLGVDPVLHGDGYDAAERHALRLADAGAAFISAYNDPHVIAGQATCLTEVRGQLPGGFTVAVPVGGGGLLAGTLLAADPHDDIRVVGVESAASRAVSAAVAAGRITPVRIGETLADGLAGNLEAGTVTSAVAAAHDVRLTAVTEPLIAAAVRYLAVRCGLVVEGAGGVGLASLLGGQLPTDRPVVLLLTGRNIAPDVLASVLDGAAPPDGLNPGADSSSRTR
jgi:threonine dehydratase